LRARVAGKTYVCVAMSGALLLAALATSRIELFMLATPLVLVLLPLAFEASAPEPEYTISTELQRDRCFEGDRAEACVTVSAASSVPLLSLHIMVCDTDNHVLASRHFTQSLGPGETRSFRFELEMPVRGVFYVGDVVSRAYTRSGLKSYPDRVWTGTECVVYPRPDAISMDWSVSARSRQHVGESASRMAGDGLEVSDVRLHMPGDPVRRINWRATQRHGQLYINDSLRDRNIDVVIVVDGLADVGEPPRSYLDCACRAAAGIALAFLQSRDRVGVIRYAGAVDWAVPRSGRNQLYAILDRLARVRTIQSYVSPNMRLIPRSVLPPGSLVLVITPLLDDRSIQMLAGLAARGCRPLVLYVAPMDLVASAGPTTDDAAALAERWWTLKHRGKIAQLRSMGLTVAEWDGVSSLDACLSRHFGAPGFRAGREAWCSSARRNLL
jgi:uncharacterized protein (DUF58 family)